MVRLLLLFTLVPVLELYLLIQLGRATSPEAVIALVLLTGLLGAALAKHQGLGLLRRMQADLSEGRLPAEGLLDGLLILVGGAFLITPGVVTDALGFGMLVPWTRRWFKALAKAWLRRRIEAGSAQVYWSSRAHHDPHAGIDYDIDMDDTDEIT